jgi:hypothetical protein
MMLKETELLRAAIEASLDLREAKAMQAPQHEERLYAAEQAANKAWEAYDLEVWIKLYDRE